MPLVYTASSIFTPYGGGNPDNFGKFFWISWTPAVHLLWMEEDMPVPLGHAWTSSSNVINPRYSSLCSSYNILVLRGWIWSTLLDGISKIAKKKRVSRSICTGTSGLPFPVACVVRYKNRDHTITATTINSVQNASEISKKNSSYKTFAQTTFNSFWKDPDIPTTFSTSLVVGCSGSDTYIESIQHIWRRLFLLSQYIFNASQDLRLKLGIVSQSGAAIGGLQDVSY